MRGQLQPYLLGAVQPGLVDPNTWGIAAHHPVSHMRVRDAAARLQVLEAKAGVAGYVLGAGARPRLWADPAQPGTGLRALEHRLADDWAQRLAGLRAQAATRGRRRPRDSDGGSDLEVYV